MSFNIGEKNSKFVAVSNVTMRFAFSEKVLFADLRTSHKTGNPKINKETGEIITDAQGNPVPERIYTHWEGRFVGNAFEPAKALKNGQAINILNCWIDKEDSTGKNGQKYTNVFAVITDFELSDATEDDEDDDEDDAPSVQVGEVPDRVKQMYEAMGVITHPDGTQELADVTTAEYDPVNKVLRFDAHGSLFWMTGDSLRELAKEVDELRVRFLDGEGQEMEAVIPLARIKDLVGAKGAFEFGLYHEGIYRFHVVGQTGYDREMFSREREKFLYENVLRENGKELVLVYHVGDEEEKAQETARVEEAIARRRQEKEQWWGVVISGLEGGSLSGQPGLTQPGTGAVGDLSGLTTLSPDSLTTAQQPETIGKQPEAIAQQPETGTQQPETSAQQPETSAQQPETSAQQPEVRGWVKDSQGKWVWRSGQESAQQPDWKPNKWVTLHDYGPWDPFYDSAYWETRKWVRVSQPPDLAWWNSFYDSIRNYDYEG